MGLWNMLKQHAGAQFLDVIEWLDDTNDTMVWRFPTFKQAITDASKLIVREGQLAVFVSEGQLSEVFHPGTYTLDTRNERITAFFDAISYQLEYPFKGDVYFMSTRQFLDQGWGTPNPVLMRDAEFGAVRIRAFGTFAMRIKTPETFLRQVVGTDGLFTTDEVTGQLKRKLVAVLAETLGQAKIPVLDLAASYVDFGDTLRARIGPVFLKEYGLELTDFTIANITLPESVEEALDARTKMGVLDNLDRYTKMQVADSMKDAANNPGMGGAGVGMGVGLGMGQQMSQAMTASPQPPPPTPTAQMYHYHGANGQSELHIDAIAERIQANRDGKHQVWRPGWDGWKDWSEVSEVASLVPPAAPKPPPLPSAEPLWHYSGPQGRSERTTQQIRAAMLKAPTAEHLVWRDGWDSWRPANEVEPFINKNVPPPLPNEED